MNRPVKTGLIGLGKIGRIHWRHLEEMSDVQVCAIADRSPAWREGISPDIQSFDEWETLLEQSDMDAVIISLPHSLHAECAKAALRAGKHVFIEKPLATNFADAQRLVACAEETGRRLMVNMTHRFYPPLQHAKKLLNENVIGQVISVRDYYMEAITRSEFPAWFFDPEIAGGGVALTDSIHLVDRVSWLLDEPLQFVGGSSRYLYPESQVEDCAEILCNSRSGIPVTIGSFFFNGPKTWEDGLTLFGTKGVMHIQAWSHVEWHSYNGKPQRQDGYDTAKKTGLRPLVGHHAALLEFVMAVREGRKSKAEGDSILNAQEIIDAFYRFTSSKE